MMIDFLLSVNIPKSMALHKRPQSMKSLGSEQVPSSTHPVSIDQIDIHEAH